MGPTSFSLLPGCIVLCLSGPLATQGQKPTRIVLHPPAHSARALQYTLLPELREQTDGNALDFYKQAREEINRFGPVGDEVDQLREDLRDAPGSEAVLKEARRVQKQYEKAFALIEKGALCERIEWGHRQGLRKQGIGLLLPHIQELRENVRLLALKAHLELAEGKVAESIRTIKIGLAMARHAAESPTMSGGLVGVALSHVLVDPLHAVMSHPDAPSLYWSLAALPDPLIDLRTPLQGEPLGVYGTFPGLADVALDPNAGAMSMEHLKKYAKFFEGLGKGEVPDPIYRYLIALDINRKHEMAKKALIASGRPAEKVEQMPHVQVAMLHALLEYDQLFDEVIKWQAIPYWQAAPHLAEADQAIRNTRTRKPDSPAVPLAPLVLPAVSKVMMAQARLERRFAMLRTIEAIRLHAGRTGKLPASLAEVKATPVPSEDPITGRPFVYRLVSPTLATLANPEGKDLSVDPVQMRYELVLPEKREN
jgi:hypothetical protein